MQTSLLIVVAGLVFAALIGVAGVLLFALVAMWFLRRRSVAPRAASKEDADAKTVIREPKAAAPAKESKAAPAPALAPLVSPPPPPPFKAAAGGDAGGKPGKPGQLLGFFDGEKPEGDAKTELFSRDMAARMAAMLDDDDDGENDGEHTELFSAAEMDAEVAAMLLEDDDVPGKLPGRVVAENKK